MLHKRPGDKNVYLKVGALVQKRGELLLIKERSNWKKKYLWNTIKGSFEGGKDKTIMAAVAREAWEEARVKIKITHLQSVSHAYQYQKTFIQFNFVAELVSGDARLPLPKEQRLLDEDIVEVRWFSRKEVQKLKARDMINNRAWVAVQDWLAGKRFPLVAIRELNKL